MSDNGKQNGRVNGLASDVDTVEGRDSDLDSEIEKLLAQVKEWRKSCKNTAQLLQELNGFLRE